MVLKCSGLGAKASALHCVLGQDALLSQCLFFTQVYKWVPVNLMLGVTLQ